MIAALRGAVACGSDGISWPSDNYNNNFPGDTYAEGNDRFNLRMGERLMIKDYASISPSVSYGTVKNPQNQNVASTMYVDTTSDGYTRFSATVAGVGADNPVDTATLTDEQVSKAVSVVWEVACPFALRMRTCPVHAHAPSR